MNYRKNLDMRENPFGALIGILVFVLGMIGLFYLARFLFRLLYLLSPILLIATLILDYRVVWGYIRWLSQLLKQNTALGIAAILLTFFGFPVVTAFLFGKALLGSRARKIQRERQEEKPGEYIDFEEIDDELELPEMPRRKRKEDYDDYV